MLEEIKNLNLKNAHDYIEKYGLIKDPELAKELLCITSNAWYILDESLKINSDIIMYYQPFAECTIWMYICMYGVYEPYIAHLSQVGFKRDCFEIPNIDLPNDFDIERYKAIQSALPKKYYSYSELEKEGKKETEQLLKNISFNDLDLNEILWHFPEYEDINIEDPDYYVYDRSKLHEIVNSTMIDSTEKNKVKKII